MDPEQKIWERQKLGLEMRHKYELYFVTLIFTLTAIAIQTAQHGQVGLVLFAEIGAWAFLILSGLTSLWRLSRLWFRENQVAEYFEASHVAGERYRQLGRDLVTFDKVLAVTEACRWTLFVLGIAGLAYSRGSVLLQAWVVLDPG